MKTSNHSKPANKFSPALLVLAALLIGPQIRAATNNVAAFRPGTLAYHLSTNAASRAANFTGNRPDMMEIHAPLSLELNRFFLTSWSRNFWLKDVRGLSATCIGYSNVTGGQGLVTMVSPRHYLGATHMHPEGNLIAFLDTNNRLHWRKTLQRADLTTDTTVGILDDDLPPTVGFLPVLPDNFSNYLPTSITNFIQGIGMNQDMCLFSQPMAFAYPDFVTWNCRTSAPFGLSTNWNVPIRGGDSSNPELLLIGNQLVLVSHNFFVNSGPNYANQISAINQTMHRLSTNNHVGTDYQLTLYPLTNWPAIR